ncbi:DUF677 domain-containing protein, partial [Cephalotus follicularis]
SLNNKLNVNEEYMEAFRTKSYIDLCSKVQGQMRRTSIDKLSSSSSLPLYVHLSDFLLEPRQETLMDMLKSLNVHHLLVDYFQASLEACDVCELLLQSIHKTRASHRKIRRVIKLSKRMDNCASSTDDEEYCSAILSELGGFALLKNPLSNITPVKFREIHDTNMLLFHKLTLKRKKIRRRVKFNRICNKIGRYSLVISHGALAIALLVIALHCMVGLVAAPGLVACSLSILFKKKIKLVGVGAKTRLLESLDAQLDIAAKGIFILINDFDTISRLVRGLYDEIEHRKAVANMCIRNKGSEVVKEVAKEFHLHESSFLEQLEELEENIYLCFHTMNRSRRLVIQHILVAQQWSSLES